MVPPDKSPPIRTQWLVDAALKRGISLDDMRAALISTGDDEPNWEALPMDSYIALFNWVTERSGDPRLGLHLANEVDLATFGGSASMIYHASNLKDCCQCLARYDQTISQGLSINFFEEKSESRLEYRVFQSAVVDVSQDTEMSLAMTVNFFRQHLGKRWHPLKVHFRHPAPEQLEDYHALFGPHVLFEQPVTAIWFDNEELNTQVTTADPYLLEVLRNHTDELQERILRQNNIQAKVRYFIARTIGSADCTAIGAAAQLYLSRRSLTRHLSAQGTSFRDLRNEITEEMAKKALTETNASIGEIALQFGYSETSAFDRAFKTLTGYSPLHYRQQAKGRH